MILAPHPDDESLATGGLLQRAARVGVATRVIFLTDGDNNPWPQRVIERRWRVSGADERRRWGALRRAEALAALATLGHGPESAEFRALPDQGLTRLLLQDGDALVTDLGEALAAWQPSHLVVPSPGDRHPDHSAVGVAVGIALRRLAGAGGLGFSAVLSYVVHGNPRPAGARLAGLALDAGELEAKRRAILCHRSQVLLSRRRFLAHARAEEPFLDQRTIHRADAGNAVRCLGWDAGGLRLALNVNVPSQLFGALKLHLLTESAAGALRHVCLPVGPRQRGAEWRVPPACLDPAARRVFVKLENRFGLYGAPGWVEQENGTAEVAWCASHSSRSSA